MEIKIYKKDSFLEIKDKWELLHSKDKRAMFYNSYTYTSVFTDFINNDQEVSVVVVKENNNFMGLCILVTTLIVKNVFCSKRVSFMNGVDYGDILIDSSFSNPSTIIKHLWKGIEKVNQGRLFLEKIPSDSLLLNYLLKNNSYNKYCVSRFEVPYVNIKHWNDFLHYKKQCLSSKVEKRRKRLQKEKRYKFFCYKGEEIPYDILVDIHKRRAKVTNRGGSVFDNRYEQLKELVKKPESYCFCIKIDDVIVGYRLAFLSNRRLFSWNTAHDYEYDKYSIGQTLIYDTIKYIYENNIDVNEYDLGGGRYAWKFGLTPHYRMLYEFRLNTKHVKIMNLLDSAEYGLRAFLKK